MVTKINNPLGVSIPFKKGMPIKGKGMMPSQKYDIKFTPIGPASPSNSFHNHKYRSRKKK